MSAEIGSTDLSEIRLRRGTNVFCEWMSVEFGEPSDDTTDGAGIDSGVVAASEIDSDTDGKD